MIDEEVIQCKMVNYTNDRQYVNKFHHNLNILFKNSKDFIGKRFEVITSNQVYDTRKRKVANPSQSNLQKIRNNNEKLPPLKKLQMDLKDDFEKPKFISVNNYNNYKYSSVFINYIPKADQDRAQLFTKQYQHKPVLSLLENQKAQIAQRKGQWGTKQMPLHLRSVMKKVRSSPSNHQQNNDSHFELNETTKKEVIWNKKQENLESEDGKLFSIQPNHLGNHERYYNPDQKIQLQTVNSALIKSRYDLTLKNFRSIPQLNENESSQLYKSVQRSVLHEVNYENISILLTIKILPSCNQQQQLIDLPTNVAQKVTEYQYKHRWSKVFTISDYQNNSQPIKELQICKEFQVLVKNSFEFLKLQKKEQLLLKSDFPWCHLFILKEAYTAFQEINKSLQDKILIAFNINPEEDDDKIFWDQFMPFRQLIISKQGNGKVIHKFLLKVTHYHQCPFYQFFFPQEQKELLFSDFQSILRMLICDQQKRDDVGDELVNIIMKNIRLSLVLDENNILHVDRFAQIISTGVLLPAIIMEFLTNNI